MLRTVVLGIGINIMLCGVAASANINTADRFHITDDLLVDDTGVIDADQIFLSTGLRQLLIVAKLPGIYLLLTDARCIFKILGI